MCSLVVVLVPHGDLGSFVIETIVVSCFGHSYIAFFLWFCVLILEQY